MRVLIVVSEAPPIESGVARCVGVLTEGLRSAGNEVDVLSSVDIPRWVIGEFRFTGFAAHWPKLARRLDAYDVVNVHGPVPTMSDMLLLLLRGRRRRPRPAVVYTHHSDIDLEGLGLACDAYNAVHRRLAQVADRVTVTSEAYRKKMRTEHGSPVTVIPWGVDRERFGGSQTVRALDDGPLRTLFVGQMRPYKGLGHLIDAVAGEDRLSLTVVGSGPLEGEYRRQAAALDAHNIRFEGRVSDDDLAGIYQDHHAIVLPSVSRGEAFGLVLLEGMAAGCVPVASDLPGVGEVAGPTGVLVRPGDTEDLRRSLVALASDPGRYGELAEASRRRIDEMGWGATVEGYEALFRSAVASRWRDFAAQALPAPWRPPERVLAALQRSLAVPAAALFLFAPSGADLLASWGAVSTARQELASIAARALHLGGSEVFPASKVTLLARRALRIDEGDAVLSVQVPAPGMNARVVVQIPFADAEGVGSTPRAEDLAQLIPEVLPRASFATAGR